MGYQIFILFFSIFTFTSIHSGYGSMECTFIHPSGYSYQIHKELKSCHSNDFSYSNTGNSSHFNRSPSHKPHFSKYTTFHDFQHHFTAHGYTENQILNQRCLYMFDEFVKFAQTYSGYTCTIQQLHAELKNLYFWHKLYYMAKGTYCPGLQKRVHYLYNQLSTLKNGTPIHQEPVLYERSFTTFPQHMAEYKALSDIYRTYTPSLSTAINKRTDAFHNMTKGDYALQYVSKSYNLNNNVTQLLNKYGHDTTRFTQCYGHQLHQALHQESLDLLDRIDSLPSNSPLYDHQEALIDFTIAMTDYNHENLTDKAMTIADVCWTMLDYGQAIAEGAALGAYTAVTDIIHNPIQATINIVAGKQVLAYQLTKVLYNVADIGITALSNFDQAKDKWNKYTEPLNNIIDAIKTKEITVRDAIKGGTAFVVGYKAQGKLLGGLGKFCNTIKQKATRLAQNNISSFTIQQYLATPEGHLLRSIEKTSCNASCPNQYEHLKQWLHIKEFTSIINTTQHGIERLIERGFTPKDISDLLHYPSFTKLQNNGAIVYIKQIQNNFNVMALNPTTKKVVTALKNIDRQALDNLGKNYGWQ